MHCFDSVIDVDVENKNEFSIAQSWEDYYPAGCNRGLWTDAKYHHEVSTDEAEKLQIGSERNCIQNQNNIKHENKYTSDNEICIEHPLNHKHYSDGSEYNENDPKVRNEEKSLQFDISNTQHDDKPTNTWQALEHQTNNQGLHKDVNDASCDDQNDMPSQQSSHKYCTGECQKGEGATEIKDFESWVICEYIDCHHNQQTSSHKIQQSVDQQINCEHQQGDEDGANQNKDNDVGLNGITDGQYHERHSINKSHPDHNPTSTQTEMLSDNEEHKNDKDDSLKFCGNYNPENNNCKYPNICNDHQQEDQAMLIEKQQNCNESSLIYGTDEINIVDSAENDHDHRSQIGDPSAPGSLLFLEEEINSKGNTKHTLDGMSI